MAQRSSHPGIFMRSTSFHSPSRGRYRVVLPIVAVAAILIFAAVVLRPRCQSVVPPSVTAPVNTPATGWRVEVACEDPQHFGGNFSPSKVLFVPAGAFFHVTAEPATAAGCFAEPSAAWDHAGGEMNPPAQFPAGCRQDCRAPTEPGLYRLLWKDRDSRSDAPQLPVVVLTRAELHTQGDRTAAKVYGKTIGAYHEPSLSSVRRVRENVQQYQIPQYFALLTPKTIDLQLGPDFTLGQLVAFKDYHGPDGHKVYTTERHTNVFPPRPELIDKLVKLRFLLRAQGVKVTRFWLTSAFRTPEYNRSIGGAAYSRHCFGDAVDLVIDEDNDKRMDDLNGDGKVDRKDGIVIGNACRELELEGAVVPGGIGVYEWDADDSVRCHVHIDCRGYISRWGQIGAGKYKKSFTWWPKAEFQEEESGE